MLRAERTYQITHTKMTVYVWVLYFRRWTMAGKRTGRLHICTDSTLNIMTHQVDLLDSIFNNDVKQTDDSADRENEEQDVFQQMQARAQWQDTMKDMVVIPDVNSRSLRYPCYMPLLAEKYCSTKSNPKDNIDIDSLVNSYPFLKQETNITAFIEFQQEIYDLIQKSKEYYKQYLSIMQSNNTNNNNNDHSVVTNSHVTNDSDVNDEKTDGCKNTNDIDIDKKKDIMYYSTFDAFKDYIMKREYPKEYKKECTKLQRMKEHFVEKFGFIEEILVIIAQYSTTTENCCGYARVIDRGDVHFSYGGGILPTYDIFSKVWYQLNRSQKEKKFNTSYFVRGNIYTDQSDDNNKNDKNGSHESPSDKIGKIVHIFETNHCNPILQTENWSGLQDNNKDCDIVLYFQKDDAYCIVSREGCQLIDN